MEIRSEEARKARNAYQRAWRAKNKDKVREINLRYWAKKADENDGPQQTETDAESG